MPILLDAALRGMLLSLLLILIAVLWRERARLAIALCLGLCVQVISSTPWFEATLPRWWQAPFVAISVGNAVLFYLLVRVLLDDDFILRPVHGVAWGAALLVSVVNCLAYSWPTLLVVRLIPLLCAVLAAAAALRHWRVDLVEQRRTLRAVIVIGGIVYSVVTLALRLQHESEPWQGAPALYDVAALLAIVAIAAFRMVRLEPSELLSRPARAAPPPPEAPDEALANALHRLMTDELAYRGGDLTVASLAARLDVPEYRLRKLINKQLGHRNFNSYINEFRLREAQAALIDPARRALPVLTIALTAGFQSIGPFNRAFKAATGLTPTEFRKENLAES
ncbi:helix-turn-helix domain-containing protein [Duganella sp. FT80W]|uniref:Helix-turn-helix domain-containing protein n=1 Tax=Duganella guangzhouensis TaxID=2666084 RepID=A0A6I2LEY6_9BURK|nr:helix-turn-helix transcriptional regulator [Duganella guangzhouensis]MRW94819.1 helix-turn-helix domain-containing protein [Duganella guangzhouensis]